MSAAMQPPGSATIPSSHPIESFGNVHVQGGAIAGVVVGVACTILISLSAGLYFAQRRRKSVAVEKGIVNANGLNGGWEVRPFGRRDIDLEPWGPEYMNKSLPSYRKEHDWTSRSSLRSSSYSGSLGTSGENKLAKKPQSTVLQTLHHNGDPYEHSVLLNDAGHRADARRMSSDTLVVPMTAHIRPTLPAMPTLPRAPSMHRQTSDAPSALSMPRTVSRQGSFVDEGDPIAPEGFSIEGISSVAAPPTLSPKLNDGRGWWDTSIFELDMSNEDRDRTVSPIPNTDIEEPHISALRSDIPLLKTTPPSLISSTSGTTLANTLSLPPTPQLNQARGPTIGSMQSVESIQQLEFKAAFHLDTGNGTSVPLSIMPSPYVERRNPFEGRGGWL